MSEAIASVVVASASAVAKVFAIGAIGYASAKRPRPVPILPPHAMNAISKMNFDLLILPLVYSTLATAVTPEKLGSLWFVVVSAFFVICLSYGVATLLGKLPFFEVENRVDFDALRIASAFPNIVALPILIFPTLCEFPVVHEAFHEGGPDSTEEEKYGSCVARSNAMIFVYFFAWNLLYWIIGYPTLVAAGERRQIGSEGDSVDIAATVVTAGLATEPCLPSDSCSRPSIKMDVAGEDDHERTNIDGSFSEEEPATGANEGNLLGDDPVQSTRGEREGLKYYANLFTNAMMQTIKSPGFIAMVLGFITACIAPLREALFSTGGALRFLGSALESLGSASSSVGTLVVAASLVHQAGHDAAQVEDSQGEHIANAGPPSKNPACGHVDGEGSSPEAGSLRASMRKRRSSISRMSARAMKAIRHRKPTIRMHAWFVVSRLIVAPALVFLSIMGMECGGFLTDVPNLAKMVVIVNAGLPGAQLIILTLKSRGLSESASVVAQVYLPSYLLSVITIAAWTSLGLMIAVPREDGVTFCSR